MINYLKDFKNRAFLGTTLLAITLMGIPFIPFVPIVVLFGGFKETNRNRIGVENGMLATIILGIIVYATLLITLIKGA
jgi:hypothetical protein